jgi:hypothetical protein
MKSHLLHVALISILAQGCAPAGDPVLESESRGQAAEALEADNGLTINGLAFNGLAFNGLAFNGLAFNGLSSASFTAWFAQHPLESNVFMKYLVRCAVPAGQTRAFLQGSSSYRWEGGLGLAPSWSNGAPATLEEQQTVSACLAALTNKYGRPVLVSLVGSNAQGEAISTTASELTTYSLREGCFFGNLFNGEGLFVGNDHAPLASNQSSLRACALEGANQCPPLKYVGSCDPLCQKDSTGTSFTRCTRQGITYHALSTRLRPQDIHTCGDGVCQFPEVCGNSDHDDVCKSDCGKCK